MLRHQGRSLEGLGLESRDSSHLVIVGTGAGFMQDVMQKLGYLLAQRPGIHGLFGCGETSACCDTPREVMIGTRWTRAAFIEDGKPGISGRKCSDLGPTTSVCASTEGCVLKKVFDTRPTAGFPEK